MPFLSIALKITLEPRLVSIKIFAVKSYTSCQVTVIAPMISPGLNITTVPCLLFLFSIFCSPLLQGKPSKNSTCLASPSTYESTVNIDDNAFTTLPPTPCNPEEYSPFFLV